MDRIDGRPVYSATDLVAYLACEHLTQLERAALAGLVERPMRNDPELDVIRKRGFEHEARFLADLQAAGRTPVTIELDGVRHRSRRGASRRGGRHGRGDGRRGRRHLPGDLLRRHLPRPRRLPAPGRGAGSAVALGSVPLRGRRHEAGPPRQGERGPPDLLVRRPARADPGRCGPCGCTSRSAGAPTRSSGFASTTTWPTTGAPATVSWRRWPTRPSPTYPPAGTYPEPVEHCDVCRWAAECATRRRADDHLSLVAGIALAPATRADRARGRHPGGARASCRCR